MDQQNVIHAEQRFRREVRLTVDMGGPSESTEAPIMITGTYVHSVPAATWQDRENSGPFSIDWLKKLDMLNLRK